MTLLAVVAVTLLVVHRRFGRVSMAVIFAALAFAVSGLDVEAWFAPPTNFGQQWQTDYGPNGNLTEALQLAANLREGHGYTLDDGSVDTYRMPGYALLAAAAGAASGASPRDFQNVGAATIWLQILLTAAAIGGFVYVAASRFRRSVLIVVALVVLALQANLQFTQGDSIMFAAALLVTTALLPFLDRARGDAARWRDVIPLHLAFGTYFLFRTDIALAWAAVSLIVHGRRWRHLALWLTVFVAIGAGFGAYAKANGSEFTFGTNNTGHVAFVGLWELPQDRFAWEPADASYDHWISAHGYTYRGPGANAFAEKEILRFYATYPGFVTTMAVNKAIRYFDTTSLDAYGRATPLRLQHRLWLILVGGGLWLLASAVLLALVAGYRRYETALLAWAALFVLPIFFFVQDENRFTLFESAALAIGGLPLLLDRGFYRALLGRWRLVAPLAVVLLAVWIDRDWIANSLLDWDGFRYWTPLLDPRNSTLAVFKH